MSFHVQKWLDISNGGSDIPSKKEANKKGGEKIERKKKEKEGKKERKRRKKKERKRRKKKEKEKSTKQKERKFQSIHRLKYCFTENLLYRKLHRLNNASIENLHRLKNWID